MIHANAITDWKQRMKWRENIQAEQDLLICRCLVAIFGDDFLAGQLAFRGGTALHKLYFQPQARYSEDIDLVQLNAGPIKPILQRLGDVLSFMPDKVVKQKRFNNTDGITSRIWTTTCVSTSTSSGRWRMERLKKTIKKKS